MIQEKDGEKPVESTGRAVVSTADPLAADAGAYRALAQRVDPQSTLPTHLQGKMFDADIWDRVKQHPIGNPELRRTALENNPETREVVRQVMAAANEREKEVLLHNQARVFQEVLGRVVEQAWVFMKTPVLVPRSWRSGRDGSTPAEAATALGADRVSLAKKLIAVVLTPNYIVLAIAAFFALATGISQVQIHNYKESIDSYRAASAAATEVQSRLESAMNSLREERGAHEEKISALDARLAKSESGAHEKDLQLEGLRSDVKREREISASQRVELEKFRSQQADDIKGLQAKLDGLQEEGTKTQAALAASQAEAKALKERLAERDRMSAEQAKVLSTRERQYEDMSDQLQRKELLIAGLKDKENLLRFAETFVDQMKHQVGAWHDPDEDEIEQAVKQYEAAKKNVMQGR